MKTNKITNFFKKINNRKTLGILFVILSGFLVTLFRNSHVDAILILTSKYNFIGFILFVLYLIGVMILILGFKIKKDFNRKNIIVLSILYIIFLVLAINYLTIIFKDCLSSLSTTNLLDKGKLTSIISIILSLIFGLIGIILLYLSLEKEVKYERLNS